MLRAIRKVGLRRSNLPRDALFADVQTSSRSELSATRKRLLGIQGTTAPDNHRGDSPDVVLHVAVTVDHPLLPKLKLHIPLPVEGEKAGIGAALEDLKKFSERQHFPQKLPMLVIGGSGNPARRTQEIMIPAKFEIIQIPYRAFSKQK